MGKRKKETAGYGGLIAEGHFSGFLLAIPLLPLPPHT